MHDKLHDKFTEISDMHKASSYDFYDIFAHAKRPSAKTTPLLYKIDFISLQIVGFDNL